MFTVKTKKTDSMLCPVSYHKEITRKKANYLKKIGMLDIHTVISTFDDYSLVDATIFLMMGTDCARIKLLINENIS